MSRLFRPFSVPSNSSRITRMHESFPATSIGGWGSGNARWSRWPGPKNWTLGTTPFRQILPPATSICASGTTQSGPRPVQSRYIPTIRWALRNLFLSCVNGDGRTDAARRVIGSLPSGVTLTTNAVRGSVSNIIEDFSYLHVLERDFAGALQHAKNENDDPRERVSRLVARVAIRVLAGDAAGEKAESEEACALMEARLRERPDDGFAMTQLSWVYLALGRKADALRMAHQAAEWLPIEKDAFGGPSFAVGLAQIQARTGEAPEAVKTLRHLLSIPAGIAVSLNRLKIDPVWDPIRSDPEFQQLLAGREEIGGYPGYGQLKLGDLRVDKIFGSRAPK